MKKQAYLFPGQGAQYPGMALDLLNADGPAAAAVKALFALASDIVGRDMEALLRDSDAATLKRTDISQPAITLANLAAAEYLAYFGYKPAACAGFSLGEYAALATAEVISTEACFRLVKERGLAMQEQCDRLAASEGPPGMAAVLGIRPERVKGLIAEWRLAGFEGIYAANINSTTQTVVSGTASALTEAESRFKEAGAKRFIKLAVAGPFHSPLMEAAADRFAPALEAETFRDPSVLFFSNVSGSQVLKGRAAKELALRQLTEGVEWVTEEQGLAALSIDACLETGPGKVLQGLWKDTGSTIPCYPAGTLTDITALLGLELSSK
ncbi:ACP S-malonyltransferase [Breznakiellaceae bacterium SP9]